jgi:hypothetical protein
VFLYSMSAFSVIISILDSVPLGDLFARFERAFVENSMWADPAKLGLVIDQLKVETVLSTGTARLSFEPCMSHSTPRNMLQVYSISGKSSTIAFPNAFGASVMFSTVQQTRHDKGAVVCDARHYSATQWIGVGCGLKLYFFHHAKPRRQYHE